MPKSFLRLIAVLLLPCFVVDPALAASLSSGAFAPSIPVAWATRTLFQEQAFQLPEVWGIRHPILFEGGRRVLHQGSEVARLSIVRVPAVMTAFTLPAALQFDWPRPSLAWVAAGAVLGLLVHWLLLRIKSPATARIKRLSKIITEPAFLTSPWDYFEEKADRDSISFNLRLISEWLKLQGYPHPDVLDSYCNAVDQRLVMDPTRGQLGFSKSVSRNGKISIRILVPAFRELLQAIKTQRSMDLCMSTLGSMLVREAWGVEMLRFDRDEILQHIDLKLKLTWSRAIRKSKPEMTSEMLQSLAPLLLQLEAFESRQMAMELHETMRQYEALRWAQRKGFFYPNKRSYGLAHEESLTPFTSKLRSMAVQIYTTRGDFDNLLSWEFLHVFHPALVVDLDSETLPNGLRSGIKIHLAFILSEITRFQDSAGREGIDPSRIIKLSGERLTLGPITQLFSLTRRRLTPKIKQLFQVWADRGLRMPDHLKLRVFAPMTVIAVVLTALTQPDLPFYFALNSGWPEVGLITLFFVLAVLINWAARQLARTIGARLRKLFQKKRGGTTDMFSVPSDLNVVYGGATLAQKLANGELVTGAGAGAKFISPTRELLKRRQANPRAETFTVQRGGHAYGLTFSRMGDTEHIASIRLGKRVEFYDLGVFVESRPIPSAPWNDQKVKTVILLSARAGLGLDHFAIRSLEQRKDPLGNALYDAYWAVINERRRSPSPQEGYWNRVLKTSGLNAEAIAKRLTREKTIDAIQAAHWEGLGLYWNAIRSAIQRNTRAGRILYRVHRALTERIRNNWNPPFRSWRDAVEAAGINFSKIKKRRPGRPPKSGNNPAGQRALRKAA